MADSQEPAHERRNALFHAIIAGRRRRRVRGEEAIMGTRIWV